MNKLFLFFILLFVFPFNVFGSSFGVSPSIIYDGDRELVIVNSGSEDINLKFFSEVVDFEKSNFLVEGNDVLRVRILEIRESGFIEVYSDDGLGLLVKVVVDTQNERFSFNNFHIFILLVFGNLILICFFIGLSFLFYIYVTQDLELVQGLEVNLGSDVKIKGEVVSIDVRDGLTFLKVKRNVVDDVIFFEELDFFESDDVVIVGEVDKYNGKYEIIGKEISK